MAYARGFGLNGKSIYCNVTKPMDIHVQFTVTPTNGLGVTSVKSNGYVRNVFMNTSTTPGISDGYTNPDPAAGFALIQFHNNFNYYLSGIAQFISPTTGSIKIDDSALTAGTVYVITTLGDAPLSQWLLAGVPPGITPAVGVSFVATSVGAGADVYTSRVSTPTASGIAAVEVVGNPGVMLASSSVGSNGGAWVLVQFLNASFAATAPAAGTVVCMKFSYDGSSVSIDGL